MGEDRSSKRSRGDALHSVDEPGQILEGVLGGRSGLIGLNTSR